MFKKISRKQAFGFTWWKYKKYRPFKRVIYNGAIRTGKTVFGAKSFYEWLKDLIITVNETDRPQGYASVLLIGTSRDNIKENVIDILIDYLIKKGFYQCNRMYELKSKGKYRFYLNGQSGILYIRYDTHIMNFKYMGANNKRSFINIQGKTKRGIFIDEGALIELKTHETLEQRCESFDDAKIFITTNPEGGEEHWFYQHYIKNKKYINVKGVIVPNNLVITYILTDNPQFTQFHIDKAEQTYTTSMFLRKILGKWVKSIGAIYQKFSRKRHVFKLWDNLDHKAIEKYERFRVGIDYGETAATCYILEGFMYNHHMDVLQEWYHKDSEKLELDINDKVDKFFEWIRIIYLILNRHIFVECESATHGKSFYKIVKNRMRIQGIDWFSISSVNKRQRDTKEKGAIEERIATLNRMLGADFVRFDESCKNTISAVEGAVRDKNGNRLDDNSVKVDELDAMEYGYLPELKIINQKIEESILR